MNFILNAQRPQSIFTPQLFIASLGFKIKQLKN